MLLLYTVSRLDLCLRRTCIQYHTHVSIQHVKRGSLLAVNIAHVLLPSLGSQGHVPTLILSWGCPGLQQQRKHHDASNVCSQQHIPLRMVHDLCDCWKPHPVAEGVYCHSSSKMSCAQEDMRCIPTKDRRVGKLEEYLQ